MTPRGKHLEEMRYALAHGLSLPEARRRLAAEKRRASELAIENLRNAPVVSGRELERRRSANTDLIMNGPAPWMMAD